MFEKCGSLRCQIVFILVMFGVVVEFFYCTGTILSKSKITMCVRDKDRDPFNVVEGKGCEKKLVLTKSVSAEEVRLKIRYNTMILFEVVSTLTLDLKATSQDVH